MFDGWFDYGGVEIVNHERFAAYFDEGLRPPGFTLDEDCRSCKGLGEVLGHATYRTPTIDRPPWYDSERPESADFAGLMVLGVTGLNGTTRQSTVTELLSDGGVPGKARRASRTIGFSALLAGRTTASVEVGLEWLTTVLTGACSDDPGCSGADLTAFIDCPAPACAMSDPDAPLEDFPMDPAGDWLTIDGVWDFVDTFTVTPTAEDILDGGAPDSDPYAEFADGGGPGDAPDEFVDGGSPETSIGTNTGLLAGPVEGEYDEVLVTWTIEPMPGFPTVRVAVGAVDPSGATLVQEGWVDVPAGDVTFHVVYLGWGEWRPAIWVYEPGVIVHEAVVAHRPLLTIEECVAPYRRRFANVTTVDGPKVVGTFEDTCNGVKMFQVEWTMVAGDAFRYAENRMLVAGMPSDGTEPLDKAFGIVAGSLGVVTALDTDCPIPPPPDLSCVTAPCCTSDLPAPPTPPTVDDSCFEDPTSYVRTAIQLPENFVPSTATGVLHLTLDNDATPKAGVRLRLYEGNPAFEIDDECAFVWETTVEYLAEDASLSLDFVGRDLTVTCGTPQVTADAGPVLRGAYGGPVTEAVVSCGRTYMLVVDVPETHPDACAGLWSPGDPQGALEWSAAMTYREG